MAEIDEDFIQVKTLPIVDENGNELRDINATFLLSLILQELHTLNATLAGGV